MTLITINNVITSGEPFEIGNNTNFKQISKQMKFHVLYQCVPKELKTSNDKRKTNKQLVTIIHFNVLDKLN